jgi:hypothetical protein
MRTPRPHARTRRAAIFLGFAAVGLLSLAGCDPRTLLYFLQPFEPTVPAPCKYDLRGKKVVVLTHATAGLQADFLSIDRDVTKEFVRVMRSKVKKIEIVSPDKVWEWVEGHPNWTDPGECAKAHEADIVIFLEMESFQIQDPGSPNLLEGNARTHIQAFEMAYPKNSDDKPIKDQPKEPEKIYDDYQDSRFPIRGPVDMTSGVSRGVFKNKFIQIVAAEISWHFVEHEVGDDIQDTKFNGR